MGDFKKLIVVEVFAYKVLKPSLINIGLLAARVGA
jgi:hypothetical protein